MEINYDIKSMTGENEYRKPSAYGAAILRLDGQKGIFKEIKDGETKPIVEKELKVIILKIRRKLQAFKTDTSLSSNEHDSSNSHIVIFEREKDGSKVKMIGEGNNDEVRKLFPELKVQQIVYVLYKDVVYKLQVKGSSLGGFWDYLKSIDSNESICNSETVIRIEELTGQLGTYFTLIFTKGDKVDETTLNLAVTKIKEIYNTLKVQEDYYEKNRKIQDEVLIAEQIDQDPINVSEDDGTGIPDDIDDIPTIEI